MTETNIMTFTFSSIIYLGSIYLMVLWRGACEYMQDWADRRSIILASFNNSKPFKCQNFWNCSVYFLGHFCMHIWAFEYRIFMETITTRGWTRVPQILQNLEIFCKILKNLKPIYQGGVLRLFWNVVYSIVSDVGMWGEWKVVERGGGYNQDGESWVRFRDAIRGFGWIS